jgi:hypothetical protein
VTLHYHGTPITPHSALMDLAGRSFCISFARPDQLKHCLRIGQAIMLDNGAFTIWRKAGSGQALPDRLAAASRGDWSGFYEWAEPLLEYRTSWGVIPDVIDGTEEENDALIEGWPFGSFVGPRSGICTNRSSAFISSPAIGRACASDRQATTRASGPSNGTSG